MEQNQTRKRNLNNYSTKKIRRKKKKKKLPVQGTNRHHTVVENRARDQKQNHCPQSGSEGKEEKYEENIEEKRVKATF